MSNTIQLKIKNKIAFITLNRPEVFNSFNREMALALQDSFDACGQNQFRLAPEANTLNWTYDACFYKDGILVNDTGNSRILKFDKIPSENNSFPKTLIGRENFKTSSEFKGNMHGTKSAIYWPFSITTERDTLFIADTGNHRIVITTLKA